MVVRTDRHTGACVWVNDGDALFTRVMVQKALLRAVVWRACQAGQIEENRHFLLSVGSLGWQV